MPANCHDIRDHLSPPHGGTARSARAAAALAPDYVGVDEKTIADWIVFARDYAAYLKYYNLNNVEDGDWTDFWSKNPAVVLAVLAAAPLDEFRKTSRQVFIELKQLEHQADQPFLQQHFNYLFDLMTTLAWHLDQQIEMLPDNLAIKGSLRNRMSRRLAPALNKWLSWHQAAAGNTLTHFPLLDSNDNLLSDDLLNFKVAGLERAASSDFYNQPTPNLQFSEFWSTDGQTDWSVHTATLTEETNIYGDPATMASSGEVISFALGHYFFTSVYEEFIQAYALAQREAEKALQNLLSDYNQHLPHFSLFLAFLRLLTTEQAYLNTLTDRHLRFYYERVLLLQPKSFAPAAVHLTFELVKNAAYAELPAGTRFKAGKDALGKNIVFALDEDFVANRAQVSEIRSLFKAPQNPLLYQFGDPERAVYKTSDRNRYFASTVANSADGIGGDLTTPDGSWHPFLNASTGGDYRMSMNAPRAEIGFAIASNYLYLTQGERTVSLQFVGTEIDALNGRNFKVELTTEKGWHTVKITAYQMCFGMILPIFLEGDVPAILPYDAAIHGGDFQTTYPVLKVSLIHDDNENFAYEDIKGLKVTGLNLFVGASGKRDFSLSGSTGPLDASKPFFPFGPIPSDGAVFTIGDKEVFQKVGVATLNINWKNGNDYNNFFPFGESEEIDSFAIPGEAESYENPTVELQKLSKQSWVSDGDSEFLPNEDKISAPEISLKAADILPPDFSPNLPYDTSHTAGYARFRLKGDWSHDQYPSALAAYAQGNGTTPPLPQIPYDASILDISLNYLAGQAIDLVDADAYEKETAHFFHLHPFGEAERKPEPDGIRLFPEIVPQVDLTDEDGNVIPQAGKDGGELLIGIEGMEVPGQLSLLFQLVEGSADPLLAKPTPHLSWFYLQDNDWLAFADGEVSDGTNGLLSTGLVRLTIPATANEEHTLLPTGKTWIRIVAGSAVEAVSSIIGIHAQAARATALDLDNDPELWSSDLPAGTIAKLVQPLATVKKVVQPYATFSGKAAENESDYYQRSSERLRHKNRAITRWDYERILLEEFSGLHKIKCLNHLRYEPGSTTPIYHELAPGHVTLIGVAEIGPNTGKDPLRPYVSLAELEEMHAFLSERTTCFAEIHVKNPAFEAVIVDFDVCFHPGYDETFYLEKLNQDLVEFLTPWAYQNGQDIEFGGKIYKGAIVNFIEERAYVDFLENLKLSNTRDANQQNVEEVTPSKRVSILVSARQHTIRPIKIDKSDEWQEACGCEDQGVGSLVLTSSILES